MSASYYPFLISFWMDWLSSAWSANSGPDPARSLSGWIRRAWGEWQW